MIPETEKQVMVSVCLAIFGVALFGIQCVILFLYQPDYPNYYIPLAYLPSLLAIILSIESFATTKVSFALKQQSFPKLYQKLIKLLGYQSLLRWQKGNSDFNDYFAFSCADNVSNFLKNF